MTVINYINASLEIWGTIMSGVVVLALWFYILLPIAAMCVQIFVYGFSLLNMVNTLCILIIFLFLQAEQCRIYAERESQLTQSRIAILLSQIQPHFLYNTLTTICGLCDENPKEAKKQRLFLRLPTISF